jgi:hypothetical protein
MHSALYTVLFSDYFAGRCTLKVSEAVFTAHVKTGDLADEALRLAGGINHVQLDAQRA